MAPIALVLILNDLEMVAKIFSCISLKTPIFYYF